MESNWYFSTNKKTAFMFSEPEPGSDAKPELNMHEDALVCMSVDELQGCRVRKTTTRGQ